MIIKMRAMLLSHDIPREAPTNRRSCRHSDATRNRTSHEKAAAIPVEDDDVIMEDEPQPEVDNDGDARMDSEDARTIAEPEMEIDIDEAEGEDHAAEVHSRRPVLLFDTELHVDQDLAHLRQGLRWQIYNHIDPASLIDPSTDYARYMACMIVHLIYKSWTGYARWLGIPYAKAKEMFDDGKRHDALGPWGPLSEVDPNTGVSRDVTDEEVLAYGRSLQSEEDPTGVHLLTRLRTNQLISKLLRGAIQLGYQATFQGRESHARRTNRRHTNGTLQLCHVIVTACRQSRGIPTVHHIGPASRNRSRLCVMHRPVRHMYAIHMGQLFSPTFDDDD